MTKKINLDKYERSIEANYEKLRRVKNMDAEIKKISSAAKSHIRRKKSITLRINESDLEMMRVKASKLGVPYQTYINILIHKDASSL